MTTPYIHGIVNTTAHPKCKRKGCGRYIPDDRAHNAKYCSVACTQSGDKPIKRALIRPMTAEDLRLIDLLK